MDSFYGRFLCLAVDFYRKIMMMNTISGFANLLSLKAFSAGSYTEFGQVQPGSA